tara:strand:+ start:297 stop:731 length:435 start_codon:yes stop_codon:yes gene_type:complete
MILIFILLLLILIIIVTSKKKESFHNFIDPRYNVYSVYNNKDFYTRFLDYFHYGNSVLPTVPLNLYEYPMNYIKSPYPIRTTTYEIQNLKNPSDYNHYMIDKYGNLHLIDYKSNVKLLSNENFFEQVWMNPNDKKIIFVPKENY